MALLIVVSFLCCRPVLAATQADGTIIPKLRSNTICADGWVQGCLDANEGASGSIQAVGDARTIPETFKPTCSLTFSVLLRGAVTKYAFGWYNVVADPAAPDKYLPPAKTDLHGFLTCDDPPGTQRTLVIRDDPGYLGGEIGFFLARPANGDCPRFLPSGGPDGNSVGTVQYSQLSLNTDAASTAGYVHLLNWQSAKDPNAFYFGWEGLAQGGDNDFDDLLTFVTGIQCSSSGASCDTGQLGICANGTEQCRKGAVVCIASQVPSGESCNAVDDDCNGLVDDGNLCPAEKVCDKGVCVPRCGGGEFPCAPGTSCDSPTGLCIDDRCASVTCPLGQACVGGVCVDPCGGVVCPYGQQCLQGTCVDRCANISCDSGYSCVLGVCQTCECSVCGQGLTCVDNRCMATACVSVSCANGQHCDGGVCVDNCQDALCPGGGSCVEGACTVPTAGAGGGTADPGGGPGPEGMGGQLAHGGNSAGVEPGGPMFGGDTGGCGCRVVGRLGKATPWWTGLLLAVVALRRRRSQ